MIFVKCFKIFLDMAWCGNIQKKKKKEKNLKADFICFWSSTSNLFVEQNPKTAVFINQDGRSHPLSSLLNFFFSHVPT